MINQHERSDLELVSTTGAELGTVVQVKISLLLPSPRLRASCDHLNQQIGMCQFAQWHRICCCTASQAGMRATVCYIALRLQRCDILYKVPIARPCYRKGRKLLCLCRESGYL